MAKPTRWTDEYYLTIYLLVKEGLTRAEIARHLGVNPETLKSWYADKPALKDAIARARGSREELSGATRDEKIFTYIYRRLPPDLAEIYDELAKVDKTGNFEKRLEIMMERGGLRARQHLWFHALISSNFNAAEACRRVNVPYDSWKNWMRSDPAFLALIETVKDMKKDLIEGALLNAVAAGDTAAIIFASKTLNRDRGYDPRLTVKHEGTVNHDHAGTVTLTELELPPETLRIILEAKRRHQVKMLPAGPPQTDPVHAEIVEDE